MELEQLVPPLSVGLIFFYASIVYFNDRIDKINQAIGELKLADNILNNSLADLRCRIGIIKNDLKKWDLSDEESESESELDEDEELV